MLTSSLETYTASKRLNSSRSISVTSTNMCSTFRFSICITLLLVFQCHGLTYWIDFSCTARFLGVMETAVAEAIEMGSKGQSQMADTGNTVMASAFEQIFKVVPSNNAVTLTWVSDVFGRIAGMTPGPFDRSDVRLYCDDDASGPGKRWQLIPDIPGDPSSNSARPASEQMWWDHVNYMYRHRTSKGCKDPGTLGETYVVRSNVQAASGQNPTRETITICDKVLSGKPNSRTLSTSRKAIDLTKVSIDRLTTYASVTLFHEFTHLNSVAGLNPVDDPEGWDAIKDLNAFDAWRTPDCYAFLGLTAILSGRNCRLSPNVADRQDGKLVSITPPTNPETKRSTRSFASLLDVARAKPKAERGGLSFAPVAKEPALVLGRTARAFAA